MQTDENTVFTLWCRLTGTPEDDFTAEERQDFLSRPQVPELARTPYDVLLEAGIAAARQGNLPLERWVEAISVAGSVGA